MEVQFYKSNSLNLNNISKKEMYSNANSTAYIVMHCHVLICSEYADGTEVPRDKYFRMWCITLKINKKLSDNIQ